MASTENDTLDETAHFGGQIDLPALAKICERCPDWHSATDHVRQTKAVSLSVFIERAGEGS